MSDAESEIDALEAEGRYSEAIEALQRLGEQSGEDVRWHIAWMHTRARDLEAARTIWDTLRAERPQDPGVPYLEGAALAEDGHFSEALGPMGEALALGLEVQSDPTLLRRVAASAKAQGRVKLDLPSLSITPPKGPLGAFRVDDEVEIDFDLAFVVEA